MAYRLKCVGCSKPVEETDEKGRCPRCGQPVVREAITLETTGALAPTSRED